MEQKQKSSAILQVLCLARVNKGAVVITEDLQVVRMMLVILLLVIQLMITTDLIRVQGRVNSRASDEASNN